MFDSLDALEREPTALAGHINAGNSESAAQPRPS
jgi:hypothetical protein